MAITLSFGGSWRVAETRCLVVDRWQVENRSPVVDLWWVVHQGWITDQGRVVSG